MAGGASVVMPETQYRKDQELVNRAKEVLGKTFGTSPERRPRPRKGSSSRGGARARGAE